MTVARPAVVSQHALTDDSLSIFDVSVASLGTQWVHLRATNQIAIRNWPTCQRVVHGNRRKNFVLCQVRSSTVTLILYSGKFRQGVVATIVYFLPPVYVLNVPYVLKQ